MAELKKISDVEWEIPIEDGMNVPGRIFASEKMIKDFDDKCLEQVKNVIAFTGWANGGQCGVSLILNLTHCADITTHDIPSWKCTKDPGAGWTEINYDDSSWPTAVLGNPGSAGIRAGNYLTVPQIWASNGGEWSTVYCRYTFGE